MIQRTPSIEDFGSNAAFLRSNSHFINYNGIYNIIPCSNIRNLHNLRGRNWIIWKCQFSYHFLNYQIAEASTVNKHHNQVEPKVFRALFQVLTGHLVRLSLGMPNLNAKTRTPRGKIVLLPIIYEVFILSGSFFFHWPLRKLYLPHPVDGLPSRQCKDNGILTWTTSGLEVSASWAIGTRTNPINSVYSRSIQKEEAQNWKRLKYNYKSIFQIYRVRRLLII